VTVLRARAADVPLLEVDAFLRAVRERVVAGERPVTLFGRPDGDAALVTAVLAAPSGLAALRARLDRGRSYPCLTRDLPRFHAFERELHEQLGVVPRDHPWLKPLRSPLGAPPMDDYPFFRLDGKEVHEVAVGPIHAGVIEPGHFRFMCLGETVHHLEIQLGFQCRGVEPLLLRRRPHLLAPLVESIAGDTSVGHALAYARALEALAGASLDPGVERSRAIALELERIAMHLVGLAGLCTDVAFLPGSSTYGRLRTAIINASMRVCGNRFGRGWVRPGGVRAGIDREQARALQAILGSFGRDLATVNDLTLSARSVRHRLVDTGRVTTEQAHRVGLLGMTARASGVALDLRTTSPDAPYRERALPMVVEPGGDCWARLRLRTREIDASLAWLLAALDGPEVPAQVAPLEPLAKETLVVSLVEGWRGEVVHALETDAAGGLVHYKVQDPSLLNWMGLALAVRDQAISDFPICNKSFDLSYCGSDL
jgi:Ni,Fe-hydrogenase III large subunit